MNCRIGLSFSCSVWLYSISSHIPDCGGIGKGKMFKVPFLSLIFYIKTCADTVFFFYFNGETVVFIFAFMRFRKDREFQPNPPLYIIPPAC